MSTDLPSGDALLHAVDQLELALYREEVNWQGALYTATDGSVTAVANGLIELTSVQVTMPSWPPAASAVEALRISLQTACGQAIAKAVAASQGVVSTAAKAYDLVGLPKQGQPVPGGPDFGQTATRIATDLRAFEPSIPGKLFEATRGRAYAKVNGALALLEISLEKPVSRLVDILQAEVLLAVNEALEKAKNLGDEAIVIKVDQGDYPLRPGKALLVMGTTSPLDSADAALQARLVALGLQVVLKTASALLSSDTYGKPVVIVSETATSSAVGTKLQSVFAPVMVMNPELFDDMKMTGGGTSDAGEVTTGQKVVIGLPDHPLAAGFSGDVEVRSATGSLSWGKPGSEALVVATLPQEPNRAALFGYDTGKNMVGMQAPARRVAWFGNLPSTNSLTDAAWQFFDAAVRWLSAPDKAFNTVTLPDVCVYASGNLQLADRVKIKRQDGSYAPIANNGTVETNVGVEAHVGDIWSRANITLRDRSNVHGFIKTTGTLSQQNQVLIDGPVQENTSLQIPAINLVVTFPGTTQGSVNLQPDQTKTIAPGAYADVSVKSRATLFLSKGTYYFNNWTVEPLGKISCSSTSGQITIYIKNGFTFRGTIFEKTGGRPNVFVGVFGTGQVPIEAPFNGTLVAPKASVNLIAVPLPGHSGAFYAKNLTIQPDVTIVHYSFLGLPNL